MVGRVAVETAARQDVLRQYGRLFEAMDITLIDTDVATHLVAGLDAAIGQSVVAEGIAAHRHREVLVLRPLPVLLHADREGERSATVLCGQLVPVVHIKISPFAVGMQLAAF